MDLRSETMYKKYKRTFKWVKLSKKQKLQIMIVYETARACIKSNPTVITKEEWWEGMILPIGRCIYECKTKQLCTGLYTEAIIEDIEALGKSKAKPSPEHAYGSHNSAKELRDALQKNPDMKFKKFLKLVVKYCFYNYSTSHENHIVKPYVDKGYSWPVAYHLNNIKLFFVIFKKMGCRKIIKEKHHVGLKELKRNLAH